jgi:S1-C subfamily serine protease
MQKKFLLSLLSIIIIIMLIKPVFAEETAYMGVYLQELSAKDYEKLGIKENYGIMITNTVKDSPAEKAALISNDVILEMDKVRIYTIDQLTKMLSFMEPKQKIKLKIFRNGEKKTIDLVLGEKIKKAKTAAYLGLYLEDLQETEINDMGLKDNYGILIRQVVKDGPVDDAGVLDGDVLLMLDKDKTYTSAQVSKILKNDEPGEKVNLKVFREKNYFNYDVILGEKEVLYQDLFKNLHIDVSKPENIFVYKYEDQFSKWIGILPKELNEQLLEYHKIENGVLIEKVIDGTPAEKADLLAGDIILKMNGENITSTKDIHKIVQDTDLGEEIKLDILRTGKHKSINVTVEERKDHHKESKVEVSFDGGDIKIVVDGKEEKIINLSNTLGKLETLKSLQDLQIYFSEENTQELNEDLKSIQKELEDIEIEVKVIEGSNGDL